MRHHIEPDKEKADSLKRTALLTLERLESTKMEEYPANTLKDYYDSIHQLMDALALIVGVKIKGDGAHQQLIDFMAEQNFIEEKTRVFLQEMRDYRNRVSYEGFMIDKDYITKYKTLIKSIINSLLKKM